MSTEETLARRLTVLADAALDNAEMEHLDRFGVALRRLRTNSEEARRIDELAVEIGAAKSIAAATAKSGWRDLLAVGSSTHSVGPGFPALGESDEPLPLPPRHVVDPQRFPGPTWEELTAIISDRQEAYLAWLALLRAPPESRVPGLPRRPAFPGVA
jgi:hypothetical protein